MNILLYGKSNVAVRQILSLLKTGENHHYLGILTVPIFAQGVLVQVCEQCRIDPEDVNLFVGSNEDFHQGYVTPVILHYTGEHVELFCEKMLPALLEESMGIKNLLNSSCITG